MIENMNVPNMDGIDDSEELAQLAGVFNTLAAYAIRRREARDCRLQGKIEAALTHEAIMNQHYRCLPLWARW